MLRRNLRTEHHYLQKLCLLRIRFPILFGAARVSHVAEQIPDTVQWYDRRPPELLRLTALRTILLYRAIEKYRRSTCKARNLLSVVYLMSQRVDGGTRSKTHGVVEGYWAPGGMVASVNLSIILGQAFSRAMREN